MSAGAAFSILFILIGGCCSSYAIGRAEGMRCERERIRARLVERIRARLVTDQATGAGDYSEAEEYADRIVQP